MSWKQDREDKDDIFNSVRERYNPDWRKQLQRHREMLHIGPATRRMSARDIIRRAMLLNGVAPRERKKRYAKKYA